MFEYFVTAYLLCSGQRVVWTSDYYKQPEQAVRVATQAAHRMHCKVRVLIVDLAESSQVINYETNPRRYPKEIRLPPSKF
jgi:hypothetical protein